MPVDAFGVRLWRPLASALLGAVLVLCEPGAAQAQ